MSSDERTEDKKAPSLPPVLDHHRRAAIKSLDLSDLDEDGARLLTVQCTSPDVFVYYLPEDVQEYLLKRLQDDTKKSEAPSEIKSISKSEDEEAKD